MEYLWTPWRMAYVSEPSGGGKSEVGNVGDDATMPDTPDAGPESPVTPQKAHNEVDTESTGCVFCDKLRLSTVQDRANLILLRAELNFVILNLYPYNSAHLMVVPKEHTADFANLNVETVTEMTALAQKMLRAIADEYKPEGFNLGMNLGRVAGAGVADHVHMHIVPRWAGDTNFMPIVGATKVMPELLETTYDRLKGRLRER